MSKAEKAVEWSITEDDSENLLRQRQRNDATSNGNAKARGTATEGDFRAQLSALSGQFGVLRAGHCKFSYC